MKRIAIISSAVVALLLSVAPAFAAPGLTLAWNNCLSEGGTANRDFACTSNTGTNVLVGSFQMSSIFTGTTGIEVVIDLVAAGTTFPAWWEMFTAGTCRQTSISHNAVVNAANAICLDWAGNAGIATGIAAYQSTLPAGQTWSIPAGVEPLHRRIKCGTAVNASSPVDLDNVTDYFAFNIAVNNLKTVGTGACAGCSTPVCIVLNSINVVAGSTSNQRLTTGQAAGANFATWQGGTGADCNSVPTKNSTWGQVKSLYR